MKGKLIFSPAFPVGLLPFPSSFTGGRHRPGVLRKAGEPLTGFSCLCDVCPFSSGFMEAGF